MPQIIDTAAQDDAQQRAAQPAAAAAAPTVAAPAPAPAPAAAAPADMATAADIAERCAQHGVPQLAPGLIRSGATLQQANEQILQSLAKRDADGGGHVNVRGVRTVQDETKTRMQGLEEAFLHRLDSRLPITDNGRQYRGMSLIELGRDHLERGGVNTRGMDRMRLATEMLHFRSPGMHSTSDFAGLLGNVANKRLRGEYDANPGTYAMWARRGPNAPDFKNINVVQLSAAPALLLVNEHAEIKYGTMQSGAETYFVSTWARIVSLTRQSIINDDLRAFDRLTTAFGASSRRVENSIVYSILTANAAMGDGAALFSAVSGNRAQSNVQTGAGSALQLSSLGAGRTAMRVMKGLNDEELNLAPRYLIVPAALEQTAYQLTSNNYVPATSAAINEFRAGGRTAVEPIVEPLLDADSATKWYLAANSSQVDTVEYCYLDGAEGPVMESEPGFDVDGVSFKCRLDFGAKAVDHRGLHRSAGA